MNGFWPLGFPFLVTEEPSFIITLKTEFPFGYECITTDMFSIYINGTSQAPDILMYLHVLFKNSSLPDLDFFVQGIVSPHFHIFFPHYLQIFILFFHFLISFWWESSYKIEFNFFQSVYLFYLEPWIYSVVSLWSTISLQKFEFIFEIQIRVYFWIKKKFWMFTPIFNHE